MIFWHLGKQPWSVAGLSFFGGSGPPNVMLISSETRAQAAAKVSFGKIQLRGTDSRVGVLSGPMSVPSHFCDAGRKLNDSQSQK